MQMRKHAIFIFRNINFVLSICLVFSSDKQHYNWLTTTKTNKCYKSKVFYYCKRMFQSSVVIRVITVAHLPQRKVAKYTLTIENAK